MPKYKPQNRTMLRCRVAVRMLLLLQAREQQNFLFNFVAEVEFFLLSTTKKMCCLWGGTMNNGYLLFDFFL